MRGRSDLSTPFFGWTKASSWELRTASSVEAHSEVRNACPQESATQQTTHAPYGSFDRSILIYFFGACQPSHSSEPCAGRQRLVRSYRLPHQDGPSLSAAGSL